MSVEIIYRENAPLLIEALVALYDSVGWAAYTANLGKMARLLPGALWHLSAWAGELPVGLVRVVGDDCSVAYVQDVLVRPDWQRRGIGRELLRRTLARFSHVRQTVLLTDDAPETRAFYQALGFAEAVSLGTRCFVRFQGDR